MALLPLLVLLSVQLTHGAKHTVESRRDTEHREQDDPDGFPPGQRIEPPTERHADEHGGDKFGGQAVDDVQTTGRLGRLGLRMLIAYGLDPPAKVVKTTLVGIFVWT